MTLTPAETLYVERRRQRKTQAEMAARYKVSPRTYRRWEAGEIRGPYWAKHHRLTSGEKCMICRRRVGLNQTEMAQRLGVSRQWVNYMEWDRVENERLRRYWDM